jgi:hypothetical protein
LEEFGGDRMKPLHIMDTNGARIFVRTLAKASNLTVVFHDEYITPHTDPVAGTIHVARPKWSFTEDEHQCWQGEILHELGHHRGENLKAMNYFAVQGLDTKTLYGTVVNILLDWINDYQWTPYDGAREALSATQRRCARLGIAKIKSDPMKGEKTRKLAKIFSWIYNQRYDTYQRSLREAIEWAHEVPYEELEIHNSELRELLVNQTGEAVEALAKKIIPPKADDKEEEQEEETDGEGEGGEQKDGEEEEEIKDQESFISYRDLLLADDHDSSKGEKGKSAKIIYDHDPRENYVEFGEKIKEIDLSEVVK